LADRIDTTAGARKATSRDVAERAGVSRAAVSMVLNGRGAGNVSPAKQEAILAAARDLRYTPNAAATSLRFSRTLTIGVVTDAIATSAFGGGLLTGAIETARAAGYVVLVLDTHRHDDRETAAFELLVARQVDGLMFAAESLHPYQPPSAMRDLPSVLTNSFDPAGMVTAVCSDEVGGGRAAAQVLLDHGHRDIVALSGELGFVAAQRRMQGYGEAMSAAGVPASAPIPAGWNIRDGYRAAQAVLRRPVPPTGLVCANDRVALGAVLAARELGLDVPRDLSIVGYDDDENVAGVMVPALTTVAIPHEAMGAEGMRRLLAAIDGDVTEPEYVELPCPLIERDSVAAPCR
jgi:LacI family transcriptional regulator